MLNTVRQTLLIASLFFTADLLGAWLAIGDLFEPSVGGLVLLGIALGNALLIGALSGVLAHLVLPSRWSSIAIRKLPLGIIALVSIAALAYGSRVGRQIPELPARPSVRVEHAVPTLWVMIDTLRRDSLYDAEGTFAHTPKLREWASDAMLFDDVESTAGWTIPSIASLMTGIHNTTMDASAGELPSQYQTVAEYMREAGYQTHAIVDNVIVEPRAGFGEGFETFAQRSAFRFVFSLPTFRVLPRVVHDKIRSIWPTAYDGAPDVTERAISRIQNAEGAPLFLYVHYMDPHAPYYAHPEIAPDPPETEEVDYYHFRDIARADVIPDITPPQLARLEHRYAGEIAALDTPLHRLLESWDARFGKDSVVMITSDHGEEFLDHGHLGHGHTVHREIVNVPLIWRLPSHIKAAMPGGTVYHQPMSQIDILPTTLDILGVTPAEPSSHPPIQGKSWFPWLRGDTSAPETPLISSHGRHGRRTYRYRTGNDVYIKTMFYSGQPTEHLFFDLEHDPDEKRNLSQSPTAELASDHREIRREFEKRARSLKGSGPNDPSQNTTNDQEALRAIGYIQ